MTEASAELAPAVPPQNIIEKPKPKLKLDLKGLLSRLKSKKEHVDEKPKIWHSPDGWRFSASGIIIQTNPNRSRRQYRLGQEDVVIPEDTPWARIDFKPGGREEYAAGTMSDSIAQGLTGLSAFFSHMDKPKKGFWLEQKPQYFWGMTNEQMARFAVSRLGFSVVEQEQPVPDEEPAIENDKEKKILVIAKTDTVQQKLAAIQSREVGGVPLTERLAQRAERGQREKVPAQ